MINLDGKISWLVACLVLAYGIFTPNPGETLLFSVLAVVVAVVTLLHELTKGGKSETGNIENDD